MRTDRGTDRHDQDNSRLDMEAKPTRAHKCMNIYYKRNIPSTCFGHSCGHPQGVCFTKNKYI
jgi:hypothetical protein